MGGIQIVDGSLVLSVTDEKQVSALAKLDANHDGKVQVVDLQNPQAAEKDVCDRMTFLGETTRDEVTFALAKANAFKSPRQLNAFRKFLDIYPKIQQFNETTDKWIENKVSTQNEELEFEKAYWDSDVYPQITGDGDFTPEKISQLSVDLYTTMYGLADLDVPEPSDKLPAVSMCCGTTFISYLVYSTANVPPMVSEQLVDAIDVYSASAAWISQYKEIECDGEGLFDGCNISEEVSFTSTKILPPHRTCASSDADSDNPHCASMSIFAHDTPAQAYTGYTGNCGRGI